MRVRRILLTLAAVILLPLLLLGAALGWLQTDAGKRWLAELIEDQVSDETLALRIGAIEGMVPFDMGVRALAVADADGVWLTIDEAALDWAPLSLLRGTVDVRALTVGTVRIDRLPAAPAADTGAGGLPRLPLALRIERLAAAEIALGEPVLGAPVRLALDGSARLEDPADGLEVALSARRIDDVPGAAELELRYRPEDDRLTVALTAEEPEGGVIARALALPGLPPVTVALSGDGPIDGWRARLSAAAGAVASAEAEIAIDAVGDARRVGVTGRVGVDGLLDEAARPLLTGGIDLSATAVVRPGGQVEIETLRLAAPAGTATVSGIWDAERGVVDAILRVSAGSPDAFAALAPGLDWSDATLDASVSGSVEGPRITAEIRVADVATDGVSADAVGASVELSVEQGWDRAIPITGGGTIEGLSLGDPALDVMWSPVADWTLAASIMADRSMSVDRLRITTDFVDIDAEGRVDPDGSAAAAGRLAAADLGMLEDLAGLPLAGAADLGWRLRTADDGLGVAVDGELRRPRLGLEPVDPLLGETAVLSAEMRVGFDGALDIAELSLSTAGNEIGGTMSLTAGAMTSRWSVSVPALAPLGPALKMELEGAATAEVELAGRYDDLRLGVAADLGGLVVDGRALPDVSGTLDLRNLADAPRGRVSLATILDGREAEASSAIEIARDGGVRLDGIDAAFAGTRLGGDLAVRPDGLLAGAVTMRAEDLAQPGSLAGLDLGGAAEARVALSTVAGRQRAEVVLEATALRVGDTAHAQRLTVTASADDLLGTPAIVARADGEGVTVGGELLSQASLRAEGATSDLALALEAVGERLSATAQGRLRQDETAAALHLAALQVQFADETFVLARPARIALSPGPLAIDRLEITGPEGRATLAGSLGDPLDVSVDLAQVPLALARLADPGIDLSGRLSGRIRVSGPRMAPVGTANLTFAEVRTGVGREADLPAADIALDGRWRGGRLTLDARTTMADTGVLTLNAGMPLALDVATGLPVLDQGAPLRGAATGTLDVALFDDLLAAGGNRVDGTVDIDLRISGTVADPRIDGVLRLRDGLYENAFYGTRLHSIEATLAASGEVLRLSDLKAATPGDGALTGSGLLSLDRGKGFPVRLDVSMRSGTVIDTPEASAVADADMRLAGPLAGTMILSGEISILSAELRVPDRLPVSVPDLPVVEVNVPPEVAARRAARRPTEPVAAFDARLDLIASATQAVFVRGRGLDVEMAGNLAIGGSIDEPAISGELTLRRGTFDLFGNRLEFQRGELTFAGGSEIDPALDLVAATRANDVVVEVAVGGKVSQPTITLSSEPELPQDEIAARLLFGKDVGSLSAFQAISLAQSLGQLTGLGGGGVGVLDEIRRTIGLDRLEVTGGDGEDQATTVKGGRYASEGVYVGVEQGLGEQSSRVNVEIELTPNIKVESDIGADAQGRIGVNLEWDY